MSSTRREQAAGPCPPAIARLSRRRDDSCSWHQTAVPQRRSEPRPARRPGSEQAPAGKREVPCRRAGLRPGWTTNHPSATKTSGAARRRRHGAGRAEQDDGAFHHADDAAKGRGQHRKKPEDPEKPRVHRPRNPHSADGHCQDVVGPIRFGKSRVAALEALLPGTR